MFGQKIADIVINYLESAHMLGLVVQNLRIIIAFNLRLSESATHQTLKLFDILKTVLKIIEIMNVLEQLFGVRVTAYLHLLDHVNVGVLVLAHLWVCSYINNIDRTNNMNIIQTNLRRSR